MGSMYAIRSLEPSDAAEWLALRLRALRDHPRAFLSHEREDTRLGVAGVAERLGAPRDRAFTYGAFAGDVLVGSVGVIRGDRLKTTHTATLWGMYVAPEHRRAGVARSLVQRAIDDSSAVMGVARIALSVDVTNHAAVALYESLGFVAWGTEPDAFRAEGDPVDEMHMVRTFER